MTKHWSGTGTKDDPWQLKTPPLTSDYTMYMDSSVTPPLLVCQVGTTKLTYLARVLEDLPQMLATHGDWMPLGAADEQKRRRGGHGGGVGALAVEPGVWLVWAEEGVSGPSRDVCATAA